MANLQPTVIAVNIALVLLSVTALSCRIGRKLLLMGSFNWHDVLIVVATVSAMIFSILQIVITRHGVGHQNLDVLDSTMSTVFKMVMASRIFYFICNWAVKHSLLLFYADLTIDRWPRFSIYFMHVVAFFFGSTCIFVTIFECNPIHKMWHPAAAGHCIDIIAFNYFNSCFMLVSDVILYAMPIVFTWNLRLRTPQKVGVHFLFALGGLVLGASAARIYSVWLQDKKPDFLYSFALTMLCAVTENHLAVVVACAPSIKAVSLAAFPTLGTSLEKLMSKMSSSSSGSSGGWMATPNIVVPSESDYELAEKGSIIDNVRPMSGRTDSTESGRTQKAKLGLGKKLWMAPSSWDVTRY